MSKHTPGPWRVVEEPNPKMISNWGIQIGSHKISFFPYVYQYADIEKTCGGYVTDQEMHANARLMAAAPELLEALKVAEQFLSVASDWNLNEAEINGEMRSTYDWIEVIRVAIAKATGGAV